MKKKLMLLALLTVSSLGNAQTAIDGREVPVQRLRLSYSHTATNGIDSVWAHSYSDIRNGRGRVISIYLVAGNRSEKRLKSGREWELPYQDLVMRTISLGSAPQHDEGTVTLEGTTPAGDTVVCKLFYGFTEDGNLRSALMDSGCVNQQ